MYIHKEGRFFIVITFIILLVMNALVAVFVGIESIIAILILLISLIILGFVAYFFRLPAYEIVKVNENKVTSPASGKIVAIETVNESEYFNDNRIQVSIFMSPANIHVNWSPIDGIVKYLKYHPGKYLVAWHPKSSTQNERFTSVIGNDGFDILVRQIAGKVARKIENYLNEGEAVIKGMELGFIKFGSRVDVFFPLSTKIEVGLNEKVDVGKTIIAKKASCTKSSLAKTAALEAKGYEVSKCAESGSLTASKTCAASGKVTSIKTCGTSGKTVKTVSDKEGNLITKEIISGEAVSKNAATTEEKAKEVSQDGAFNFSTEDLMLDGYTVKACAASGSTTAKKTCAASGKVTKIKQSAEGVVTKTVADAEGVVLSTEILQEGEEVVADDDKNKVKAAKAKFDFANLESEGYKMGSCAASGSKTASKSCTTSGKTTDYKMCGKSGKVTKTVTNKDGKVVSTEVLDEASNTADAKFDFANLESEGYKMGSCAASGSKTASKSCVTSGKTTDYKMCGKSGKVTKTVTDKDGKVVSTEVLDEASNNTAESMFNFAKLEGEGFKMKSCADSGNKYASKTCAASGKTTDYKACGASGKVTKTVTDKEGEVLSSEIVSNLNKKAIILYYRLFLWSK